MVYLFWLRLLSYSEQYLIWVITVEPKEFESLMLKVIASMKAAGYDPLAQFTGYLQTGDDTFVTRTGDARTIVRSLDKEQIAKYVDKNLR